MGCIFATYVAIIGSYVFGSRFETKDYLNAITRIIPDFDNKRDDDNYGGGYGRRDNYGPDEPCEEPYGR